MAGSHGDMASVASDLVASQSQSSPVEFTLFPSLPVELRFKIWNEAFCPRVVEIHLQGDADSDLTHAIWVSNSDNPAVMSACSESRTLALKHFTVLLPFFKSDPDTSVPRYLYFSPTSDLLAFIGEPNHMRLLDIFRTIQQQDPAHRGLQRVGMSISSLACNFDGAALKIWKGASLADLKDLVIIYDKQKPPASFWRGEVGLKPAKGMNGFTRMFEGQMRKLLNFDHVHLMNLTFSAGLALHCG
ncbi:hypothetical protein F5Y00DRAFT_237855 [Daldinia vernicosa]|uniref:uncharacterized protein n=1 Tax=Daldinia vernicosa TaxID=114800 RepID=UPI00200786AD|nr:uncharacterized protein F5Y00DRAFT_237855 [Daldinia vernicosa]KAI0848594.1 hypothetical protein F5Y00DRAFT_237855 [Daldinia vernicosa]